MQKKKRGFPEEIQKMKVSFRHVHLLQGKRNRTIQAEKCTIPAERRMPHSYLGSTGLFTISFFHNLVPLRPPLPNQQNDGFPLEFVLQGPQTELTSNRIANSQLSLNWEQTEL